MVNSIKIKQLRKEKGLTQKKLAMLINISNTYLSDIETGRTTPSIKTLDALSKVLEVDFQELLIKE